MKVWHFKRGRNMFRMSFDEYVWNVKEHFSICVHAYVCIGLCTQLVIMRTHTWHMCTQAPFMHTRPCSLVYTDTQSNLRTHVASLHMQMRAHERTLALRNPISTILTSFFHLFSHPTAISMLYVHLFTGLAYLLGQRQHKLCCCMV